MKIEGPSQLSSTINSIFVLPPNTEFPLVERPQLVEIQFYTLLVFQILRTFRQNSVFTFFDQVKSYVKKVRYDEKTFSTET